VRPIRWSTTVLLAVIVALGVFSGELSAIAKTAANSASDRSNYIRQADRLCDSANVRQRALRRQAQGLPTVKLAPILRQQAKIAARLATNLGKLSPPARDRLTVGRFVKSVRQLSLYSKAVATAIAAGRPSAARTAAAKLRAARERETLLAQGYGYKSCGSRTGY
jgi:hypothetical protein